MNVNKQVLILGMWLLVVGVRELFAQSTNEVVDGKWVKAEGVVIEKNLSPEEMKKRALNEARKEAMKKAGLNVASREMMMRSETGIDFYATMAEIDARGVIIDERNVVIGEVEPAKGVAGFYRVEAKIEAFVVVPKGEIDKNFTMSVKTDKEIPIYRDGSKAKFIVESEQGGYLTIFNISNDSLVMIFPNTLTKNKKIKGTFTFPENNMYDMVLETKQEEPQTVEQFIFVLTKNDTPFSKADKIVVKNERLKLSTKPQFDLYRWLANIPLNERIVENILLTVVGRSSNGVVKKSN